VAVNGPRGVRGITRPAQMSGTSAEGWGYTLLRTQKGCSGLDSQGAASPKQEEKEKCQPITGWPQYFTHKGSKPHGRDYRLGSR